MLSICDNPLPVMNPNNNPTIPQTRKSYWYGKTQNHKHPLLIHTPMYAAYHLTLEPPFMAMNVPSIICKPPSFVEFVEASKGGHPSESGVIHIRFQLEKSLWKRLVKKNGGFHHRPMVVFLLELKLVETPHETNRQFSTGPSQAAALAAPSDGRPPVPTLQEMTVQ